MRCVVDRVFERKPLAATWFFLSSFSSGYHLHQIESRSNSLVAQLELNRSERAYYSRFHTGFFCYFAKRRVADFFVPFMVSLGKDPFIRHLLLRSDKEI